jgi:uncharacterized protein YjbI with pentapeptide repeats
VHDERLRADCERCFALCCVAPTFSASADFAITKPAGHACPNLGDGFACTIHARLRQEGFPGCDVYDCFGAGQRVAQETFAGRDWRQAPETSAAMFAVFDVMRGLHELLWYLTEAAALAAGGPLDGETRDALDRTERLAALGADDLRPLDIGDHRRAVGDLLARVSVAVRSSTRPEDEDRPDLRSADLVTARLAGADLRAADLRGARLLGADLRGADLRGADVLGADLRAADLSGADLTGILFLVPAQVRAARGDGRTRLPPSLARPDHWTA